ncbi:MAG: hypothetical protein U0559_16555 [Anaerolineae bacterium]
MSAQSTETESSQDFYDSNLLLGLAVAAMMALAWWGLMDVLQVPHLPYTENPSLQIRLLALLHTSLTFGFVYGALSISWLSRPISFFGLIGTALIRSLLGGLGTYCMAAGHMLLEEAFDKAIGDTLFWTLFALLATFALSSTGVIALETKAKSINFREYWHALFQLNKRATLRWIIWTICGGYLGFLIGLALNHIISLAEFALLILPVASWGLWWGKPAIVFNSSRRNDAIRTILGLVAIIGPIFLMTFNVQFGLMVLVSVILLYAVITLRR